MQTSAPQNTPAIPAAPEVVTVIERIIKWVGSPISLGLHTVVFIAFFAVSLFKWVAWDTMFAVLTNVVSLEAIYLAIFIQMSVNRQSASLKEVEEDVGDIQEDIEELGENVEDLKEDVEDIQEDIGDINEDDEDQVRERKQAEMLEALTNELDRTYRESHNGYRRIPPFVSKPSTARKN